MIDLPHGADQGVCWLWFGSGAGRRRRLTALVGDSHAHFGIDGHLRDIGGNGVYGYEK